jgi:hypothetical protein
MGVKVEPHVIKMTEKKTANWRGHVKRMSEERIPKQIMECVSSERRNETI